MAPWSSRPTSSSPSSSRTDRAKTDAGLPASALAARAGGLLGQADPALGAPEARAVDRVRDPAVDRCRVERLRGPRRLVAAALADGTGQLGGGAGSTLTDDGNDLVVKPHVAVPRGRGSRRPRSSRPDPPALWRSPPPTWGEPRPCPAPRAPW